MFLQRVDLACRILPRSILVLDRLLVLGDIFFDGLRPCVLQTFYQRLRRTLLISCHTRLFASHSARLVSSFPVPWLASIAF